MRRLQELVASPQVAHVGSGKQHDEPSKPTLNALEVARRDELLACLASAVSGAPEPAAAHWRRLYAAHSAASAKLLAHLGDLRLGKTL